MISDKFIDFLKANFDDFVDNLSKNLDKNTDIDSFLSNLFADPQMRSRIKQMYEADQYAQMGAADKFDYYFKKYEEQLSEEEKKQQQYRYQQERHRSQQQKQQPSAPSAEQKYYAVLEVKPGASFEEVRASYKNLMKKYHPDKFHNDPELKKDAELLSKKINEAYTYLEKKLKK